MKDFIYNLYSSDNFTLYLTIALVVLIILFFIVLFFGKKDKKLQETQKLQKVADGFKEEKTEQKVEVPAEKEDATVLIKPMDEPAFDELALDTEKPAPTENVPEDTMVVPSVDNSQSREEEKEEISKPFKVEVTTMMPEAEDNADVTADIPEFHFDELSASLEKELTDLENIKNEFQNITLPEIEKPAEPKKSEEVKPTENSQNANPQVFSSVFVNPKAPEENTAEFELPTLKKTEAKEESKDENNFDLADIKGETYDLNEK